MREIHVNVEDNFMMALGARMRETNPISIMREAFTLINWAADQRKKGHTIISADADGHNVRQLSMPSLDRIQPK